MVEALPEGENSTISNLAAAANAADDDNLLLIDTGDGAKQEEVKVPEALQAADDSYEETQMNMNGFFCDNNDQVSCLSLR